MGRILISKILTFSRNVVVSITTVLCSVAWGKRPKWISSSTAVSRGRGSPGAMRPESKFETWAQSLILNKKGWRMGWRMQMFSFDKGRYFAQFCSLFFKPISHSTVVCVEKKLTCTKTCSPPRVYQHVALLCGGLLQAVTDWLNMRSVVFCFQQPELGISRRHGGKKSKHWVFTNPFSSVRLEWLRYSFHGYIAFSDHRAPGNCRTVNSAWGAWAAMAPCCFTAVEKCSRKMASLVQI